MSCPNCRGENTTEIIIHLKDEETVQFYSCRKCEAKWWEREGDAIDLAEVLQMASNKRD